MQHESDSQQPTFPPKGGSGERPGTDTSGLLEAASRLAGGNAAFCFGRDQQRSFSQERAEQIKRLGDLPVVDVRELQLLGTGGEHHVFAFKQSGEDRVLKVTLPGVFGRTIDEDRLLDPRTFLNMPKLKLRDARPSEYLLRWALLDQVFGLQTRLEGVVKGANGEPQIAISQLFIGQDMPTEEEVSEQMKVMGFEKVDGNHVINPENSGCTWYRQLDGVLITDAFARNYRLDFESALVIPVDLMVNIVPPGASQILPAASEPFQLPIL